MIPLEKMNKNGKNGKNKTEKKKLSHTSTKHLLEVVFASLSLMWQNV